MSFLHNCYSKKNIQTACLYGSGMGKIVYLFVCLISHLSPMPGIQGGWGMEMNRYVQYVAQTRNIPIYFSVCAACGPVHSYVRIKMSVTDRRQRALRACFYRPIVSKYSRITLLAWILAKAKSHVLFDYISYHSSPLKSRKFRRNTCSSLLTQRCFIYNI